MVRIVYGVDSLIIYSVMILFCWNDGPGEGGNNPGTGGEGGLRKVDFDLECPGSRTRGQEGSCKVTAPESDSVDMRTLRFEWSSNHASTSGLGINVWTGAATETTTIKVKVTDPSGGIAGFSDHATITVNSRGWSAPSGASIKEEPADLGSVNGNFYVDWPSFSVKKGGGPWSGRWYVHRSKDYTVRLRIHHNLDPRTKVKYGTTDDLSAVSLATDCADGHTSLGSEETVPSVNSTCGTKSQWQALRDEVVAHENEHKAGYDSCVPRMNSQLKVLDDFAGAKADAQEALKEMSTRIEEAETATKGPGRKDAEFILWYHIGYWWLTERTAYGHDDSGPKCVGG